MKVMRTMKMIPRPDYLNQLIRLRDKRLIKVITGIRRCGKSTLFDLFCEWLRNNNVVQEQIIRLNLEDPYYCDIQTDRQLYDCIHAKLLPDKMNYIFIDEVQNVRHFQKTVDGLFIQENCDVYVTGSNAYILSGELATLLSGRYIEIKMLPLSFQEYMSTMESQSDLLVKYRDYVQNGSFPYILQLENSRDRYAYLEGIYSSIVLKDIVTRRRISDTGMLDSVIRYMFDTIGNICSSTKIANAMTSGGRKISVHTVESYLSALTDSFVLFKVGRYDVQGKRILASLAKYYLSDIGLRYYLLGNKQTDMGHILENVIYLELVRRGYQVFVGKVNQAEVDFIAIGDRGTEYYQVAYSALDSEGNPLQRELSPLEAIKDHNPKYLLTMDFTPFTSHKGIKQFNALEWLLGKV
jgi:hypothetical protein